MERPEGQLSAPSENDSPPTASTSEVLRSHDPQILGDRGAKAAGDLGAETPGDQDTHTAADSSAPADADGGAQAAAALDTLLEGKGRRLQVSVRKFSISFGRSEPLRVCLCGEPAQGERSAVTCVSVQRMENSDSVEAKGATDDVRGLWAPLVRFCGGVFVTKRGRLATGQIGPTSRVRGAVTLCPGVPRVADQKVARPYVEGVHLEALIGEGPGRWRPAALRTSAPPQSPGRPCTRLAGRRLVAAGRPQRRGEATRERRRAPATCRRAVRSPPPGSPLEPPPEPPGQRGKSRRGPHGSGGAGGRAVRRFPGARGRGTVSVGQSPRSPPQPARTTRNEGWGPWLCRRVSREMGSKPRRWTLPLET